MEAAETPRPHDDVTNARLSMEAFCQRIAADSKIILHWQFLDADPSDPVQIWEGTAVRAAKPTDAGYAPSDRWLIQWNSSSGGTLHPKGPVFFPPQTVISVLPASRVKAARIEWRAGPIDPQPLPPPGSQHTGTVIASHLLEAAFGTEKAEEMTARRDVVPKLRITTQISKDWMALYPTEYLPRLNAGNVKTPADWRKDWSALVDRVNVRLAVQSLHDKLVTLADDMETLLHIYAQLPDVPTKEQLAPLFHIVAAMLKLIVIARARDKNTQRGEAAEAALLTGFKKPDSTLNVEKIFRETHT